MYRPAPPVRVSPVLQSFGDMCARGNVAALREFGQLDVNAPVRPDGKTALHIAASAGDVPMIHYLLTERRAHADPLDSAQDTPLGIAAQLGRVEGVQALLGLGADPSLEGGPARRNRNAIFAALHAPLDDWGALFPLLFSHERAHPCCLHQLLGDFFMVSVALGRRTPGDIQPPLHLLIGSAWSAGKEIDLHSQWDAENRPVAMRKNPFRALFGLIAAGQIEPAAANLLIHRCQIK